MSTVLVVEDDYSTRLLTVANLRRDFEVVSAEDGKLLLRIRFKHQPDGSYSAACLAYNADEAMQEYYAAKAAQPRNRGRRKGRRKKV